MLMPTELHNGQNLENVVDKPSKLFHYSHNISMSSHLDVWLIERERLTGTVTIYLLYLLSHLLEETTRTPSYYMDEDYPTGPEIQ